MPPDRDKLYHVKSVRIGRFEAKRSRRCPDWISLRVFDLRQLAFYLPIFALGAVAVELLRLNLHRPVHVRTPLFDAVEGIVALVGVYYVVVVFLSVFASVEIGRGDDNTPVLRLRRFPFAWFVPPRETTLKQCFVLPCKARAGGPGVWPEQTEGLAAVACGDSYAVIIAYLATEEEMTAFVEKQLGEVPVSWRKDVDLVVVNGFVDRVIGIGRVLLPSPR